MPSRCRECLRFDGHWPACVFAPKPPTCIEIDAFVSRIHWGWDPRCPEEGTFVELIPHKGDDSFRVALTRAQADALAKAWGPPTGRVLNVKITIEVEG